MPILRDIQKLVAPNYGKGVNDTISYINAIPWSTGVDVSTVSLSDQFGAHVGTNGATYTAYLQATITSSSLTIPVASASTTYPLSIWPSSGYFLLESEVIQYTSINPESSSSSGYDEFVCPSTAFRGVKGTTAAGHSGGVTMLVSEILFGSVTSIEYNTDDKVFNVFTDVTQSVGPVQSYGADSVLTITSRLFPLTEDNVTFFEYEGVTA